MVGPSFIDARNCLEQKKGLRNGALSLHWGCLRRATRLLERRESGRCSLVRIAIGVMQSGRWRLELEPRQQGFVLWVIGEAVHGHGVGSVWQALDDIAIFKVVLAIAVRRKPPGRNVMHAVAGDKRIVKGLR